ncbi:hypothetical protein C8J56DRAFT_936323 [Mycena floridula]|nr:hypothetical protein C8J56DRAFT_936323 [Mycena floridula]
MWSTVRLDDEDLDIIDLDDSGRRQTLLMLGVQLYRSGSHQLYISITSTLNIPDSHPLLQVLFPTSPRWKALFLFVPVTSFPAFARIRGSLSSLQTLHIWSPYFAEQSPINQDIVTFEFAPKLTTLLGNPFILHGTRFPYAQITKYESSNRWTCCAYAELPSVLPNLEQLTLNCHIDDPLDSRHGIQHTRDSISLPKLHSARLISDTEDLHSTDCALLRRLSVPALKKLEIAVCESVAELRAMLQRSCCSLNILDFGFGSDIPDDVALELFHDVPTLNSLALNCSNGFAMKIIDELTRNSSLVSTLQVIDLWNSFDLNPLPERVSQLKAIRPNMLTVGIAGINY